MRAVTRVFAAMLSALLVSMPPVAYGQGQSPDGYYLGWTELPPEDGRGPAVPHLTISTKAAYGCLGYQVRFRSGLERGTFKVVLLGVTAPRGPCATAIGPARAQVPLKAPDGGYRLLIRASDDARAVVDRYTLGVRPESIEVGVEKASFTEFVEPRLERTYRILGYACGAPRDSSTCEEFERELREGIGLDAAAESLRGPYVPEKQVDDEVGATLGWRSQAWRYEADDTFEGARERLLRYAARPDRSNRVFSIRVTNWDGRQVVANVGIRASASSASDSPAVEIREWPRPAGSNAGKKSGR